MKNFYLPACLGILGLIGIQDISAQGNGGVIINNAPEGTKQLYSRESEGFYYDWGVLTYGEREGGISIIEGEDGFIYIHNPLSGFATGSYLKGVKDGNQIKVELPQLLYREQDFETGEMLYFEAAILENSSTDAVSFNYSKSDENELILNIGEDGSISFNLVSDEIRYQYPPKIFGMISSTGIFYVGDESQTLSPVDYAPVTPPEGLDLTNCVLIDSATGDDHNISIGFDNNDVYLYNFDNIYARNSWIKGTIDGDIISFPTEQFLGEYNGYFYWYLAADFYETSDSYSFVPKSSIDFEYNREKMLMITPEHASMVANPRKEQIGLNYPEFMWYEQPVIKIITETPSSYKPQNPRFIGFVDYTQYLGYKYCEFGIYPLSVDYDLLDTNNLYFHLYLNGVEEEVFMTDGNYDFPFNFFADNQGTLIIQSFGGNVGLFLMMDGLETIGIELINKVSDNEIYSSDIVTYDIATGEVTLSGTEGVEELYSGEVVSTEYYDLSGNKLDRPKSGIIIQRQRYSDGSTKSRKLILK